MLLMPAAEEDEDSRNLPCFASAGSQSHSACRDAMYFIVAWSSLKVDILVRFRSMRSTSRSAFSFSCKSAAAAALSEQAGRRERGGAHPFGTPTSQRTTKGERRANDDRTDERRTDDERRADGRQTTTSERRTERKRSNAARTTTDCGGNQRVPTPRYSPGFAWGAS